MRRRRPIRDRGGSKPPSRALRSVGWQKSSYSGASNECVEARAVDGLIRIPARMVPILRKACDAAERTDLR
ncbi:DUF397 domain-containing protein [Kitasatospora viridis]|uniref:DUF397 domain-containing protein n=1 Tax=Kitasatospora viridis TaxID=281105 RepID=UPI0014793725